MSRRLASLLLLCCFMRLRSLHRRVLAAFPTWNNAGAAAVAGDAPNWKYFIPSADETTGHKTVR